MLAIREALALRAGGAAPRGGFLLGCSEARYALLVAAGGVLVVEEGAALIGFAVTLADPVLRASDLWARRALIRWRPGASEPPSGERVAYFDQLALAPSASRLHAPMLALASAQALARSGHRHLYATTLRAPVRNAASLGLLRAVGARVVGEVTEHYDEVGEVVSDLHHAVLPDGLAAAQATAAGLRSAASSLRLAA